jgi:hypothetical protein
MDVTGEALNQSSNAESHADGRKQSQQEDAKEGKDKLTMLSLNDTRNLT